VEKLETLQLRKEWMNDLTQAVACLESLNLAYGDVRPENILLDRDRLKLSDFDCTAETGTTCEGISSTCGRILNDNETDQGECGTSGLLGPRTEQFALGSIYHYIKYGFEPYGDRCLTEDPHEHGLKTLDLLQDMLFPNLDGNDPLINNIIDKCWHNKYATISELASCTKVLLDERIDVEGSNGSNGVGNREDEDRKRCDDFNQDGEDFLSKRNSARTWRNVDYLTYFAQVSLKNLDSLSVSIDILSEG